MGGVLITVGLVLVALSIVLFVASLVTTPATAGIGTWLGASLALNTFVAGLTFITKGIEILYGTSKSTCGLFSVFHGILVANIAGHFANWIGVLKITKESMASLVGGGYSIDGVYMRLYANVILAFFISSGNYISLNRSFPSAEFTSNLAFAILTFILCLLSLRLINYLEKKDKKSRNY